MEFDQGSNVRDRPLTPTVVDKSASDRTDVATNASTLVSPSFAEDSEEKIGGRVGRYRLHKELGAGGMGVVYEGYDPDLERPVAVKLLHAAFDRERLSREARALAKVSHPNVVGVFDVGTFGARAFIAMELVDGVTLRAWIAERRRSLEEILGVAMQAGRGLAAAHAAGLLHRDFKPDNVMVGRDGRVRVLDFGIVRAFDASAAATSAEAKDEPKSSRVLTFSDGHWGTSSAGTLVGTPAYMAPEQVRARTMTPAADQFSFCVVLWELVYGERPFAPDVLLERMRGGEAAAPKVPERANVPSWLRRVLQRGLAFESVARYPSMAALLEVLEVGLKREATERRLLGRRYEVLTPTLGTTLLRAERAFDRITGRLVAIKRLPAAETFARETAPSRDALEQAFKVRAALRHPNLIEVLDFGYDRAGALYWVLDLKDEGDDLIAASRRPGASSMLGHLGQLLRALRYAHAHGVYLGALGPATVLVVDGQVKLAPLGHWLSPDDAACIAPEVAAGAPPSAAADLYAFAAYARQCLSATRGDSAALSTDFGEETSKTLERLLSIEPAARYQTVDEVVRALAGEGHPISSMETLEVRESHLRAAPFLGRDAELAKLAEAVQAARAGRGAAWLLSGESGVGKSRLLEQVAALSVATGCLVLRGHEEREGGSPYRLFRDVLRGLALLTDLDESEGSALLPVVPNLREMLGRAFPLAPELDGLASHARLVEVVRSLLLRQEQPLVIVLEDIQWARSDSIDLLKQLGAVAANTPVLIVATARVDALPAWREALASLRRLHLGRFAESAIAALAEAMIGSAGNHPALLRLLQRETEGNAFFLVEVVRALAEAAGGLARIGAASLPERVFAEGVQSLVQQRLRAISGEERAFLRVAAVFGRRLDPKLLANVMPGADLDACIATCVDAAILERTGDGLRFCHDKLREGVLASLSDEERTTLHARIAAQMEVEHALDPNFYATLADHYQGAKNPEKEAHYAGLAGDYALLHGAIREAIALLERSRIWLAEHGDAMALGRVCVALSDAYLLLNDMHRATEYAAEASAALGFPFAVGNRWRAVAVMGHLLLHVLYRCWPALARGRDTSRTSQYHLASIAAGCAGSHCINEGSELGVLYFSLKAWNLAQRAQRPNARASGVLGYSLTLLGFPRIARAYFAPSECNALTMHDSRYAIIKMVFFLGIGELSTTEALIREGFERLPPGGYDPSKAVRWFVLGHCALLRGDLAEAEECFGHSTKDEGARANFWPALAFVRALTGRYREAEALLEESLREANPSTPRGIAFGVLALIQALGNDVAAAQRSADQAVALVGGDRTFGFSGSPYFAGVFETFLAEFERARSDGRPTGPARSRLRRIARRCRSWARVFRVGRPLALFYDGKIAKLFDQRRRAQRLWEQSRELARSMDLDFYAALAARELEAMSTEDALARRARANSPT